MVRKDCFKNTHVLTHRIRNLYELCVGHKTINNQLARLGTEVAELNYGCLVPRHLESSVVPCQWLLKISSTAGRTFPAILLGCQGPSWREFCPCLGVFHRGSKSPPVLLDRNVSGVVCRIILQDTLPPFARQHCGESGRSINNITSMNSARPFWISGAICTWNACSVWWPACPGD